MRHSFIRSALAGIVVAVGLAATPPHPAGAQSDPEAAPTIAPTETIGSPVTPSGDPAIDDLVGCVQGSRQLLVLFLIDESASLKQTDSENRRVDAARGALDSLIALASSEGSASPNVDVALAAFSNDYRLVQDWTPAGPDTADSLNDSLDKFAEFNSGIDTDFVNALSAGREALAEQAAVVTSGDGEAPCRAVMLFTDGGYDLAVRTSEADQERLGTTKPYAPGIELTSPERVQAAEALGRQALCSPGGLADRLRVDDVTLLTVALSGDVARRSQLPLAAASAGTADDYTCGTQPAEGETSRVQGAYLPAEDIDVLVTQFNGVGIRLAGGNLVPGPDQVEICGQGPCAEGSRTFVLDRSLRRAHILALPPEAGATVVLQGPGGETAEVSEASTAKVGATALVTRSVAGRGFAIDLERPSDDASWSGQWTVSITDPEQAGAAATLQIFVFSDIGVAFGKQPPLERGVPTPLQVVLELPEGVEAADVIETSEAKVRLRNPVTGRVDEVPLAGESGGPFIGTFETPATLTSNVVEATAEVRITTTGDAVLVSQSAPSELLVRRPEGSIQYSPGSLQMPSLTGKGSTESDLVLIGGNAPGCVWFGESSVPEPPDGATPVVMTLADGSPLPGKSDCIDVPADAPVAISIEASPGGRASGTVSGTLQVFEKVDGREQSTTEVPFRFDMARGVDQAQRLLLSLLLLVAGLGLPLLLLLLLNALTARFQSLDAVQGTALPVEVSGKAIFRVDGAYPRPLSLRSDDFGSLATAGSKRRFIFGGVEFRARASRNPFGATIAMAAPEGGAEKLKGKVGRRVELDPALAGSWIFLLDSDQTGMAKQGEVLGLLIAFVAEGAIETQIDRMMPDITDRLPGTADRLAGLVRSVRRKAPKRAKAQTEVDDQAVREADGAAADSPEAEPQATSEATVVLALPATFDSSDAKLDAEEPATPEAVEDGASQGAASTAAATNDDSLPPDDNDDPGGPPAGFTGIRPD